MDWYKLQSERYERALKRIKQFASWLETSHAKGTVYLPLDILGRVRAEIDTALGPNADVGTSEQRALQAVHDLAVAGRDKSKQACYFRGVEAFEAIISKCKESL
jgi:hypothetical protein